MDSFILQPSEISLETTSKTENARCNANEQSAQPAPTFGVESKNIEGKKHPKSKDLEQELRAACAHALSLCAFQDDLELELNRWADAPLSHCLPFT
jgi:hypothetical protein